MQRLGVYPLFRKKEKMEWEKKKSHQNYQISWYSLKILWINENVLKGFQFERFSKSILIAEILKANFLQPIELV
jgi:hypothetical protein